MVGGRATALACLVCCCAFFGTWMGVAADGAAEPERRRYYGISGRWAKNQLPPVREALGQLGFTENTTDVLASMNADQFELAWTVGNHLKKEDLKRKLQPHVRTNNYPCVGNLGNKGRLHTHLAQARELCGEEAFDFEPLTFYFPRERAAFMRAFEAHPEKVWISKPPGKTRGKGIAVLAGLEGLPTDQRAYHIVQEYLGNPFLVDGFKQSIRLYVYSSSFEPLRAYLYKGGVVPFTTVPYQKGPEHFSNKLMHVTNYAVQLENDEYREQQGGNSYWSLERLLAHIKELGHDTDKLWAQMKAICAKTMMAVTPPMNDCARQWGHSPDGFFQLWGFDIMLDADMRPYIIEVNHTPSMETSFPEAKKLKPVMLRNYLRMAMPSRQEMQEWRSALHVAAVRAGWSDLHTFTDDDWTMLTRTFLERKHQENFEPLYAGNGNGSGSGSGSSDVPYHQDCLAPLYGKESRLAYRNLAEIERFKVNMVRRQELVDRLDALDVKSIYEQAGVHDEL